MGQLRPRPTRTLSPTPLSRASFLPEMEDAYFDRLRNAKGSIDPHTAETSVLVSWGGHVAAPALNLSQGGPDHDGSV